MKVQGPWRPQVTSCNSLVLPSEFTLQTSIANRKKKKLINALNNHPTGMFHDLISPSRISYIFHYRSYLTSLDKILEFVVLKQLLLINSSYNYTSSSCSNMRKTCWVVGVSGGIPVYTKLYHKIQKLKMKILTKNILKINKLQGIFMLKQ